MEPRETQGPDSVAPPVVEFQSTGRLPRRRSRPMIWSGVAVALGAVILGIVAVFMLAIPLTEIADSERHAAPDSFTEVLEPGEYAIFADETVASRYVAVAGPADEFVSLQAPASTWGGFPIAGATYRPVAYFQAHAAGEYRIDVDAEASVFVATSPSAIRGRTIFWLATAVGAAGLVVVGAVLILVGALRREKAPPLNV